MVIWSTWISLYASLYFLRKNIWNHHHDLNSNKQWWLVLFKIMLDESPHLIGIRVIHMFLLQIWLKLLLVLDISLLHFSNIVLSVFFLPLLFAILINCVQCMVSIDIFIPFISYHLPYNYCFFSNRLFGLLYNSY
jgi:hypothetical protein